PVLVAAELPDPLPPELAAPPGPDPALRVLVLGPGRGYVRTLLTERQGRVAVTGTPLLARCDGLGRAVARVLNAIPPVLPPAPAAEHAADLFEEDLFEMEQEEEREGAEPETAPVKSEESEATPEPGTALRGNPAETSGSRQAALTPAHPRTAEPDPSAKRT